MDDSWLVDQCLKGKTAYWNVLVRRYHDALQQKVSSLVKDPADATEVVDEAFLKARSAISSVRDIETIWPHTFLQLIGMVKPSAVSEPTDYRFLQAFFSCYRDFQWAKDGRWRRLAQSRTAVAQIAREPSAIFYWLQLFAIGAASAKAKAR